MTKEVKQAKTAYKQAKKAYKRARRKNVGGWKFLGVLTTILTVLLSGVTVFLNVFDNTIAAFVGGNFTELVNKDDNAQYFKSDFATADELVEKGEAVAYQVELEGAALLMNNNEALPLSDGAIVNTLSSSSVDLVYGGTGSGNVDASKALNLKASLEQCGLEVNETLWNYYLSEEGSAYRRSAGSGESAVLAGHASINEVNWNDYPDTVKASIEGEAVIITLSRVGGEGYDLNFHGITAEDAEDRNYLALNADEISMFEGAKELKEAGQIEKIIVLINTSNALQVDFLKDNKYDVDACLWVGGLGGTGTEAVGALLAGKDKNGNPVNPSGSLVDTYAYDNYSSPAMQNFVALTYQGDVKAIPDNASTYMVYQEGIYVGYKYYETRYEDFVLGTGNAGEYTYGNEVAFPFGYGLSYSTFEYSNFSTEDKGATVEVTVTVTNNGPYAGKETVQIYSQAPYTQYDKDNGVEKASVNLVGFEKTDILEMGESATLTIEVDKRDIASYDAYGYGTYILDQGTYYLTAATDSHNAINNILAAKGLSAEQAARMDGEGNETLVGTWTQDELDATAFATSLNGTAITNQLSDADPNLYFGEGTIKFLSRNDWAGTFPTPANGEYYKDYKFTLNDQMIKELQEGRYANMPEYYADAIAYHEENTGSDWSKMPTLGADNGMKLYDMMGKDYDDPAWNTLLEQLTLEELVAIGDSFHWRMPVLSVNAPGTRDENGPQGLTASLLASDKTQMKATALTSEDVMAATFNRELIEEVGNIIGNDCLWAGVACLYGPGANTHRTPYGGRNFEYYSEDGFLACEMGGAEVKGIQDKGVDVVMKHFALNDTEQDRLGQAAWINEQAAREIYLKAFQKSLEESGGNGVMTAYTRWGTTWSGAHFGLMTNIMRREWGNVGMSITDNILVTYTNAVDAVIAGGVTCFDAMLWYATDALNQAVEAGDTVAINAMVQAMHHNLYTLADSSGMNGVGANTIVKRAPLIANIVCEIAAWVFGILTVIVYIRWIGGNWKIRKERKEYKAAKKAYKKAKKLTKRNNI